MPDVTPVRRALLAVYDKAGVVELARELASMGVALVSSGGTARTLRDAGIDVTPVEEVLGRPASTFAQWARDNVAAFR